MSFIVVHRIKKVSAENKLQLLERGCLLKYEVIVVGRGE